ncbi:hypothetical protein [Streptomyces zhihengii]
MLTLPPGARDISVQRPGRPAAAPGADGDGDGDRDVRTVRRGEAVELVVDDAGATPGSWTVKASLPAPATAPAVDAWVGGGTELTVAVHVGGGLLSTAFEIEYGRPTSLVLPRYPDEAFGDLVVTLFADCGGTPGQSSRRLGERDAVVTALVRPDGAVELFTADDSLPEASSGLRALLARLGSLTGRR